MTKSRIPKQHRATHSKINEKATILKQSSKILYLRLDFTYLNTKYECFSEWGKDKLKRLSNYIEKHRALDIQKIQINSSGHDCTEKFNEYMKQFKNRFSEDILPIMSAKHLYAGDSERLHGFIHANIFYVLRLDHSHKVNSK